LTGVFVGIGGHALHDKALSKSETQHVAGLSGTGYGSLYSKPCRQCVVFKRPNWQSTPCADPETWCSTTCRTFA